jgi:hypothetical protein
MSARDVATRCAACRDLARIGEWSDIGALVERVAKERSAGVRLYAAAAATDIAMRERAAGRMTDDRVDELHAWLRAVDPGPTPSILMLASAAGDRRAVERLGRLVRDPRNLVRAGAVVALRRLVLSHTAVGRIDLEAAADHWFDGTPADALADLVRLVGEVGWARLFPRVEALASSTSSLVSEAVAEALERRNLRERGAFRCGLWVADGKDVFEVNPEPTLPAQRWLVMGPDAVWTVDGREPLTWQDGVGYLPRGQIRLVWGGQVGVAHRVPALQIEGVTWWMVAARAVPSAIDDPSLAVLGALEVGGAWALEAALAAIDDHGDGDPGIALARGRLALAAGDSVVALQLLDRAASQKKPRSEVWFWTARAAEAAGVPSRAVEAYRVYLERAPKRAEHRAAAEASLAALGPSEPPPPDAND